MSRKDLISVIVPVYNVDKYLPKCIDSIINQTYKNLEIILIDDGSTDSSPKICDEYMNKDSRIIVIHKDNGGLSSARNKGIEVAKGNLICFIDSDDYLELNMLEELKNNMDKYDSDIACCNFYDIKNEVSSLRIKKDTNIEFVSSEKEKFINIQNEYSPLTYYAWNKLYKKEIFNNIRFPEGRLYEYTYILCDIFDKANRISFTLKPLYNYVYRSSSLGNSFNLKHFDKMGSFDKKIEFFNKKKYYDLLDNENSGKACAIIRNLSKMKFNKIKNKEVYKKYYKELKETTKEIKWEKSNKKIKLFKIFKSSFIELYCLAYKIRDIKQKNHKEGFVK